MNPLAIFMIGFGCGCLCVVSIHHIYFWMWKRSMAQMTKEKSE